LLGSNLGGSLRQRYFTFVIQSSGYAPDELQRRAEVFIATLPDALGKISDDEWRVLVAGARSKLQEKPKNLRDKADVFFERAFNYDREWDRQVATLAALDTLTQVQAQTLLRTVLTGPDSRQRTILLSAPGSPRLPPLCRPSPIVTRGSVSGNSSDRCGAARSPRR
jgi:secreted Zn-dependent insulinase-like peptidase